MVIIGVHAKLSSVLPGRVVSNKRESDSDVVWVHRVWGRRGAVHAAASDDGGDGEEHRNGLVNVGHYRSADSRQATLDHRRAYAPTGPTAAAVVIEPLIAGASDYKIASHRPGR